MKMTSTSLAFALAVLCSAARANETTVPAISLSTLAEICLKGSALESTGTQTVSQQALRRICLFHRNSSPCHDGFHSRKLDRPEVILFVLWGQYQDERRIEIHE